MILTPKMWAIKLQIEALEKVHKNDPGDYMLSFEIQELEAKLDKLRRIEKLGLRLVQGGKQPTNTSTAPKTQSS